MPGAPRGASPDSGMSSKAAAENGFPLGVPPMPEAMLPPMDELAAMPLGGDGKDSPEGTVKSGALAFLRALFVGDESEQKPDRGLIQSIRDLVRNRGKDGEGNGPMGDSGPGGPASGPAPGANPGLFAAMDAPLHGLNLNVHFHMLFLDGVYVEQSHGSARFRWVKAPTSPELTQLTHTIAHRVGRYLERQGLLERDVENSYLASDAVDDDPMTPLLGHSITYRIAVGSQAGRKVFTLQTLPTSGDPFGDGIGKVAGSSLHAGVAARADERKKLERLCRYISRPAVSEKRLSLTRGGNVRYQLKTPYRDGTTHVIFEPLDFIARLAALVPKPRVNLTRFHGVFAPNSRHRALVTPAKRGRGNKVRVADEPATPAQRRASMTWAQRLKRVFNIDIETCSGCGGAMKVIACIEDPIVIKQILDHLKHKAETSGTRALPESRAPPAELLLGLFD